MANQQQYIANPFMQLNDYNHNYLAVNQFYTDDISEFDVDPWVPPDYYTSFDSAPDSGEEVEMESSYATDKETEENAVFEICKRRHKELNNYCAFQAYLQENEMDFKCYPKDKMEIEVKNDGSETASDEEDEENPAKVNGRWYWQSRYYQPKPKKKFGMLPTFKFDEGDENTAGTSRSKTCAKLDFDDIKME